MFDVVTKELLKPVKEMVERREKFSKMQVSCPECHTKQVQLCDWSTDTGKFKCRHCKHKFTVSL